jgi:hypothetical protein
MQSVPEHREIRSDFGRGRILRAWSSPFLGSKQAGIGWPAHYFRLTFVATRSKICREFLPEALLENDPIHLQSEPPAEPDSRAGVRRLSRP